MSITLAQLEREVARRTGPYITAAQASGEPTSSTPSSAIMPMLQTTALVGGPENLWILRRGVLQTGAPTPSPVAQRDRQRLVQAYDSGAGRVIVDRNWQIPMFPDELAEFVHLNPAQELYPSVMAGLRRCFLSDTTWAQPTSAYGDVDLTVQHPWITGTDQVVGLRYGWMRPGATAPFNTYLSAGHVMLGGAWAGYTPASSWVTALRPAWTLVNGAYSATGPTEPTDVLDVDLDYAASAGHIEAWHMFPSRMYAAAAGNLQANQEMAAREFTRQALIWGPPDDRSVGFTSAFGLPTVA